MIEAIDLARVRHQFDLWAYIIMPEHIHLLLFPRPDDYSISAILSTMKQSVAKKAVAFVHRQAPEFAANMLDVQRDGRQVLRFWQRGGGYDRNLWGRDEIWEKIRYTHENPLRRKLCGVAEEWLWSSAGDYSGVRRGFLRLDLESLPR